MGFVMAEKWYGKGVKVEKQFKIRCFKCSGYHFTIKLIWRKRLYTKSKTMCPNCDYVYGRSIARNVWS